MEGGMEKKGKSYEGSVEGRRGEENKKGGMKVGREKRKGKGEEGEKLKGRKEC